MNKYYGIVKQTKNIRRERKSFLIQKYRRSSSLHFLLQRCGVIANRWMPNGIDKSLPYRQASFSHTLPLRHYFK